jgi:hypothetical protein
MAINPNVLETLLRPLRDGFCPDGATPGVGDAISPSSPDWTSVASLMARERGEKPR